MEVRTSLLELVALHPRLLWFDSIAAVGVVLGQLPGPTPYNLIIDIEGIPSFDDPTLTLTIDTSAIDPEHMARLTRTYEPSRLVEMAAIAIAAVAIFHVAHTEVRDMARRGSGADYFVGEAGMLLEVGGRSRRADAGAAWRQKWDRLTEQEVGRFFVFVVEFETPSGRLGFHE